MKARTIIGTVALGAAALTLSLSLNASAVASAGVSVATCNQVRWCTITASGDASPQASQLAIGNVSAGTKLAVTEFNVGQNQLGGQILNGSLDGNCGWSQYARDWTPVSASVEAGCANPVLDTVAFVAKDGKAIWSGCYPRCFGGVPLKFEKHCGSGGRKWCYRSNCEEYANFYPWTSGAHPANPIRLTKRHTLDIRYLARYGDAWTDTPFYLVRDVAAGHGTGNWVFISGAACGVTAGPPGNYHWLPHAPKHRDKPRPAIYAPRVRSS